MTVGYGGPLPPTHPPKTKEIEEKEKQMKKVQVHQLMVGSISVHPAHRHLTKGVMRDKVFCRMMVEISIYQYYAKLGKSNG